MHLNFHARARLIVLQDTPWDEPSSHSIEFLRYMSGEIFSDSPWNRIGQQALCIFFLSCENFILNSSPPSFNHGDFGCKSGGTYETSRHNVPSLVCEVLV